MGRFGSRNYALGAVLGLALVVAAAIVVAPRVRDWASPPLERGRAAYSRGDWASAESLSRRRLQTDPNDPEATRLLARSYARLGRSREALALEMSVGPEAWQAEDLVLIGKALREDGRTVLGWAAFDAAAKIDPKSKEASDALVNLGVSAAAQGDVVRRADLITAVPNGRVIAELLAGLVPLTREGAKPGDHDPILARFFERDRTTFAAVDSPDSARKLLARLLLQAGRPAEALTWLERTSARSRDEEAQWLASRAYLAEGKIELASTALERAGRFGQETPQAHEPATYVGAKSCAECHSTIYQSEQGGPHGLTMTTGKGLETVPLPKGVLTDPVEPNVTHRFERTGDRIKVESRVGDKTIEAVIAYALGSGRHGVTMLGLDSTGRYRSLRISHYTSGDRWDITSGFEPHPTLPENYLGMALSTESFQTCLNCHTTRFTSEADRDGPEARDNGIGCEKCHGPAGNHAKAVEEGFPQLAIARPKLATPAQRTRLCGQCHGADGQIPPSDPRYIKFQATTLPFSRCVTESGGKLDCVTCHDPHKNLETSAAYYEARCLACHGEGAPRKDKAIRVEAVVASRCKANARSDCVKCHMPKVENVLPFTAFTDHHIRAHRTAAEPDKAEACP